MNELENRKTIEKINQMKSWFFKKIKKIDKPLDRLTKEKKRKGQNQQNYKWKGRHYNGYHRNSKDHKRLLLRTIYQQTGQPRRNGNI